MTFNTHSYTKKNQSHVSAWGISAKHIFNENGIKTSELGHQIK